MASLDKRTTDNRYGYLYLCPNCERILDIQEHYDALRFVYLVTVSCGECNIFANDKISELALSRMALDRKSSFSIFIEEMLLKLVDPIRQAELELEAEARAECDLPF